jgi:hypothetical protein
MVLLFNFNVGSFGNRRYYQRLFQPVGQIFGRSMPAGALPISVDQLHGPRHPPHQSDFHVSSHILLTASSLSSAEAMYDCPQCVDLYFFVFFFFIIRDHRSLSNSNLVGKIPPSITNLEQLVEM